MSIAENIAVYRKKNGLTQEQLGHRIGVTNQAVSKWESAVSLPDVMLLPKIADALGITLNELYGIKSVEVEKFPDSPMKLQEEVRDKFCRAICPPSLSEFLCAESNERLRLKRGITVGWVAPTEGTLYMTDDAFLLETMTPDVSVFEDVSAIAQLKKLTHPHVRKVLQYFGKDLVPDPADTKNTEFYDIPISLKDIVRKCSLSEEEAFDALDKLLVLRFIERNPEDGVYLLHKSKVIYAASLLRAVSRMIYADFAWGCPNLTALRIGFIEQ